jgi:hypothetical protein
VKQQGRFLNRVQVENFASPKLEVNEFIPNKFATSKLSAGTRFKNHHQVFNFTTSKFGKVKVRNRPKLTNSSSKKTGHSTLFDFGESCSIGWTAAASICPQTFRLLLSPNAGNAFFNF